MRFRLPPLPAVLVFALALGSMARAGDGPPIVITSPDQAVTYRFASLKQHELVWDRRTGQLYAHIVFTEIDPDSSQQGDDVHDFRLPGVTYDEKKGLFFATSARGELIPVARVRKTLFLRSIEPLPNARVRVEYPRGNVSVVLEAVSPNDPAMHPAPAATASSSSPPSGNGANPSDTDSDGNHLHQVDWHSILQ